MSRWLWALLGGVVLVAIAAVFWIASNQTNVTPSVSPGPTPVAPSSAPAPTAQNVAPSPSPSPPAAQEAAAPPAPTAPPAPNPAPDAGQQAASPPPVTPSAPPVVAQEPPPPPAPAPVAEATLPPPAPGREAQEVAGMYAPKSLAQLVGTWAYSATDCERLFQRRGGGWAYRQPVDKFAQAAIVESTKRILLPSAICRIDGASEAEGALKVSADCEDSISYTSRSVMIALRSPTELIYSASGDPALATTLKKCPP
jgi:hypothetical protein